MGVSKAGESNPCRLNACLHYQRTICPNFLNGSTVEPVHKPSLPRVLAPGFLEGLFAVSVARFVVSSMYNIFLCRRGI